MQNDRGVHFCVRLPEGGPSPGRASSLKSQPLVLPAAFAHRRQWHTTPVLLPGKSHGRRSLVGCSPWGSQRVGHDWTELLHFHFSLSCNPLQCSCLENPRDGGAWWAAVYGAAQSWTRLKRLSSSSSSMLPLPTPGRFFSSYQGDQWLLLYLIQQLVLRSHLT